MYADSITPSMASAIDETNRRRAVQVAYNTKHGIDPQPLRKEIADITDMLAREDADTAALMASTQSRGRKSSPLPAVSARALDPSSLASTELAALIQELTEQMHAAAGNLEFEVAARLRDEISDLKRELRQMIEATK